MKKIFKKRIIIPLLIVLALTSLGTGVTYAYWSVTETIQDNVVTTATLSFNVNGVDGNGDVKTNLEVGKLVPSTWFSRTEQLVIDNTGEMELNYQIEFTTDSEHEDFFSSLLVSFDDGDTWTPMTESVYTPQQLLEVENSNTIDIKFRLSEKFWDISYMGFSANFDVVVTAIQSEDSFTQ